MSVVLGLSVAAMLGTGMRCGPVGGPNGENQPGMGLGTPVAEVAGEKIYDREIDSIYQSKLDSQLEQITDPGMRDTLRGYMEQQRVSMTGTILDGLIRQKVMIKLAKARGADLSDAHIKSLAVNDTWEGIKQQLSGSGKLKPGASQADFEAAVTAEAKRPFSQVQTEIEANIQKQLQDPALRGQMIGTAAALELNNQEAAKIAIPESELKATYDSYKLKRITLAATPTNAAQVKAKAESVLKEIKGGLSFEAAMDKYSTDPAQPKQKKSDATVDLPAQSVNNDPTLRAIAALKPNEVSPVLESPGGPTIYKLIAKEQKLPADFDKQKETLKKQLASTKASKTLNDLVDAELKKEKIVWSSEGYHVLYDYQLARKAPPFGQDKAEVIVQRALKAGRDADAGAQIAAAVAFEAFNSFYAGRKPDEQKKLIDEHIEVLKLYVERYPAVGPATDLAQLYLDKKSSDEFITAVTDAANANSNQLSPEGESGWIKINGMVGRAEAASLVKEADVADVRAKFKTWQTDYADQKKVEAERAAQEKKDLEQQKKDEADRAKEAAAAAKKPVAPNVKNPAGITPLPDKPKK